MSNGYSSHKVALNNRLKRVEGQVRAVNTMVQDDAYCIDILTQIAAIRGALDKVTTELVRDHTKHCLQNDSMNLDQRAKKADELVSAIARML